LFRRKTRPVEDQSAVGKSESALKPAPCLKRKRQQKPRLKPKLRLRLNAKRLLSSQPVGK
jgi:hypothetical protein